MEVNIAIAVDHYLITSELNLKSLHGYSKLPIRPTSTNITVNYHLPYHLSYSLLIGSYNLTWKVSKCPIKKKISRNSDFGGKTTFYECFY